MKAKIIAVVALASSAAFAAHAAVGDENTRLFQDWHYGQNIDDFPRSHGYYDCSGDLGTLALCYDSVTFVGYQFQGQLFFSDENTLVSVSIVSDYSDDLYGTLVGTLVRNFGMIFSEGPSDTLDLVEKVRQGAYRDEEAFELAMSRFESEQMRQGYFGMTLVEVDAIERLLPESSNAQALLLRLDPGSRAIEVVAYEDDLWGASLGASFYLPAQQIGRMEDQIRQAPVEDF